MSLAVQIGLRPPPTSATTAMQLLGAPPRLVAHLILVHDVACELIEAVDRQWPSMVFDRDAVRFGSATHDLGKARALHELSMAGSTHEKLGTDALTEIGVSAATARFCVTHGRPPTDPGLNVEDLIVIAADKIWKGKRVPLVEETLAGIIAGLIGADLWDVLPPLLDILDELSSSADQRLTWQNQFPISSG